MTSRLVDPLHEREKFLAASETETTLNQDSFSIGELAREFGVSLRTLRFYEDKGLITPKRAGAARIYSRRDRARLKLVLMGKRVGFPLKIIRELIDLYDLRDGQVTQLRVARAKFARQIAKLEKQRNDIEEALDDLRRASQTVQEMLTERAEDRIAS